jgi:hypothetical protein
VYPGRRRIVGQSAKEEKHTTTRHTQNKVLLLSTTYRFFCTHKQSSFLFLDEIGSLLMETTILLLQFPKESLLLLEERIVHLEVCGFLNLFPVCTQQLGLLSRLQRGEKPATDTHTPPICELACERWRER